MTTDAGATVLAHLEAYYDLAPRGNAEVEEVGPFTLFRSLGGYPYYARPRLGGTATFAPDDVRRVLARQRDLDVPQALEWVDEVTPSLLPAARDAGMEVELCPLLVLEGEPRPPSQTGGGSVRLVGPDDADLPAVALAIHLGFGTPGTARGEVGVEARDTALASDPAAAQHVQRSVDSGRQVLCGAFVDGAGAVGGGSHNPRGATSEIAGVAVLPAFRRRGLAADVAALLSRHALDHGVSTVFCGAQSEDVARVYAQVGFRAVGTACIATAHEQPS